VYVVAEFPVNADQTACNAQVLDEEIPADNVVLQGLRADPRIEFIDTRAQQAAGVRELHPPVPAEVSAEPTRWAYYPWRRTAVGVLGPRAFRELRLNRNKNLITADEQARLGNLRIGVAGLSVGHVIAHTLATEGLCGELRLADFDHLELSNLNRVPATVLDLGENKATVAARRIAEIDPYLPVRVFTLGVTPDTIDDFLDGLDILVEECDSLDMKAKIREAARARRIPVLMATSDRGLVDVERFDLEPDRPILHGLLGDVDSSQLAGLTARQKIPHMLGILDVARSSPRAAASMLEVGRTLTTWPQLMNEVALGASTVAVAVRRLGLGEELVSGRVRIDIADALDHLAEPPAPPDHEYDEIAPAPTDSTEVAEIVAAAAILAPSGGNAQPWVVETTEDSITIRLAPNSSSTMDVGFRGSALAVGAAMFNARVAAAAHKVLGPVEFGEDDGTSPLHGTMQFAHGEDADLAGLYQPMLRRETNRHLGTLGDIDVKTVTLLESAARREGARLQLLTDRDELEQAATILAAADRIRYLTPSLHADMVAELRWPLDPSPETGIDVLSLGLGSGDLAVLDILRRPEVMSTLARWGAGEALGADTADRVRSSSALGVVSVRGQTLTDYARGGSAVEAVWVAAQQLGLAVQPVSPVFLLAQDYEELCEMSPTFAPSLEVFKRSFRELVRTPPDELPVLLLRFAYAPPTQLRSRRRGLRLTSG
jgi:molybdopterin/thiamine biosynthesis adenylyltransferase/nitroreductase